MRRFFRRLIRNLAIKTGAYPQFILKRLFWMKMNRVFKTYVPFIVDIVSRPNPILNYLKEKWERVK